MTGGEQQWQEGIVQELGEDAAQVLLTVREPKREQGH